MGKRSCSTLIICRFMGTAMKTPSMRMVMIQRVSFHGARVVPVTIMRAGMAETRPAEAVSAQAAAMVCRMLFSRIVRSLRKKKGIRVRTALKTA
ncbi:MAG: hypothetical protein P8Z49_06350 [Acidobacteriota bacterium]